MLGFQEFQSLRNALGASSGLNMLKNQTKFKVKYCRECQEVWVLTWDESANEFFDGDFYFFDFDYEFHKIFHQTNKLLSEIKELLCNVN